MRPSKRNSVSKSGSANRFKHHVGHTKMPNIKMAPMRGGWRL